MADDADGDGGPRCAAHREVALRCCQLSLASYYPKATVVRWAAGDGTLDDSFAGGTGNYRILSHQCADDGTPARDAAAAGPGSPRARRPGGGGLSFQRQPPCGGTGRRCTWIAAAAAVPQGHPGAALYVAFKGTDRTVKDVFVNMCFADVEARGGLRGHAGVVAAVQDEEAALLRVVRAEAAAAGGRVIFCGHSLGGGLAQAAAFTCRASPLWPTGVSVELVTFGAPSILATAPGDAGVPLPDGMHPSDVAQTHFVSSFDVVPRLPLLQREAMVRWIRTLAAAHVDQVSVLQWVGGSRVKAGIDLVVDALGDALCPIRRFRPCGTFVFLHSATLIGPAAARPGAGRRTCAVTVPADTPPWAPPTPRGCLPVNVRAAEVLCLWPSAEDDAACYSAFVDSTLSDHLTCTYWGAIREMRNQLWAAPLQARPQAAPALPSVFAHLLRSDPEEQQQRAVQPPNRNETSAHLMAAADVLLGIALHDPAAASALRHVQAALGEGQRDPAGSAKAASPVRGARVAAVCPHCGDVASHLPSGDQPPAGAPPLLMCSSCRGQTAWCRCGEAASALAPPGSRLCRSCSGVAAAAGVLALPAAAAGALACCAAAAERGPCTEGGGLGDSRNRRRRSLTPQPHQIDTTPPSPQGMTSRMASGSPPPALLSVLPARPLLVVNRSDATAHVANLGRLPPRGAVAIPPQLSELDFGPGEGCEDAKPFTVPVPLLSAQHGSVPFLLLEHSGALGAVLWEGDRAKPLHPAAAPGADRITLCRGGPCDAVVLLRHALFCAAQDAAAHGGGTMWARQAVHGAAPDAAVAGLAVLICACGGLLVHAVGLPAGTVLAAGRNQSGELATGDCRARRLFGSCSLPPGELAADAALTSDASLLLTVCGRILAAGRGAAAYGAKAAALTPEGFCRIAIPGEAEGRCAVAIACGYDHAAVATADGALLSAGRNRYGELGAGHQRESGYLLPATMGGSPLSGVAGIACGYCFTIALLGDGSLAAAGYNGYGNLGIGDRVNRSTAFAPVPAPQGTRAVAVRAGLYHSMLLCDNGALYAAGANNCGQLGLGSGADSFTRVAGLGEAPVVSVSCGYYHSAAVTADGAVYVTGYNTSGELGLGHCRSQNLFVRVRLPTSIGVWCGCYCTFFQTVDGTILATGYNNHGNLGLGETDSSVSTVLRVCGLTGTGLAARPNVYDYSTLVVSRPSDPLLLPGSGRAYDAEAAARWRIVEAERAAWAPVRAYRKGVRAGLRVLYEEAGRSGAALVAREDVERGALWKQLRATLAFLAVQSLASRAEPAARGRVEEEEHRERAVLEARAAPVGKE
eukprot:TRINITY_DN9911_c0_g2_i1.p1 TRINITY_DN9911_c0_g2~~TRINITY_DN9911_c0_g2_i1.p1  ORF type:complete len:1316 (+),score=320.47 TRINITY_DN9911_c0_g2_i1:81-4028(+)